MSEYYLTKDELYHHGIQGQKWGLRRWQNEDGSLTPAGREHYGYGGERYSSKERFKNAKSEYTKAKLAVRRAKEIDDIEKALDRSDAARATYKQAKLDYRKDKTIKKAEQKAWKQQRKDYIKTKTTGERIATGLLLGPIGLYNYNSLMAAGASGGNKLVNFGKVAVVNGLTGGFGNMAYSSIVANKEKEKY